jgi:hypothetical protein
MIMLLALLAAAAPPKQADPPQLCRTARGRLTATNGSPSVRIWVVGARHYLGLPEQGDMATKPLPANVERLWGRTKSYFEASVYGDFRVCGWRPPRAGKMEMVRLVSARNLRLAPLADRNGREPILNSRPASSRPGNGWETGQWTSGNF